MSDQERMAIEEFLRSGPDLGSGTVEEVRARYDTLGDITPVAKDVVVEAAKIGGVPGEHVRAPNAIGDGVVLYFHGGGYMIGSLASHRGLVALLSNAAGTPAFSVNYRLAPEHPFPAAHEDALAVYRALIEAGTPATRIALAGDSAGGGLALVTLMRARDAGLPMPACAFLMSPFVDLAGTGDSVRQNADVDVVVRPGMIEAMGGTYLNGVSTTHPHASPLYGDPSGLPPLLIHVGTHEAILDDSLRFVRRAAMAHVPVELSVYARMPHVWQMFAGRLEEGRRSLAEAGAFMKRHLGAAHSVDQAG
jgi:acetyl esterase/lipase